MISVCVFIQSSRVSLTVRAEVYFACRVHFLCYLRGAVHFYGRDGQGRHVFEKRCVSVCVSEQAENENESKQQCAAKSSTATPSL